VNCTVRGVTALREGFDRSNPIVVRELPNTHATDAREEEYWTAHAAGQGAGPFGGTDGPRNEVL
jgi:hypothetical protein